MWGRSLKFIRLAFCKTNLKLQMFWKKFILEKYYIFHQSYLIVSLSRSQIQVESAESLSFSERVPFLHGFSGKKKKLMLLIFIVSEISELYAGVLIKRSFYSRKCP